MTDATTPALTYTIVSKDGAVCAFGREDFVATANSFAISTKMKQADAYIRATGVDATPTIIVAGKYRLNYQSAGGDWDKMGQMINYLVRKESVEK